MKWLEKMIYMFAKVIEFIVMGILKPLIVFAEWSIPLVEKSMKFAEPYIQKGALLFATALEKTLVPPMLLLAKALEKGLVPPLVLLAKVLEKGMVPPLVLFAKVLEKGMVPPMILLAKVLEKTMVPPLVLFAKVLEKLIYLSLGFMNFVAKVLSKVGKGLSFILKPIVKLVSFPIVVFCEGIDKVIHLFDRISKKVTDSVDSGLDNFFAPK